MPTPPSKGFLLPDVINPPNNICFVIAVPNDPRYVQAFWGAYERLGHWWAWERDEAKRGKDAAERWREAVMVSRLTWDEIGDFCDMNITVNVTQPCCDNTFPPFIINNNIHIGQEYVDEILALPGGAADDGANPPTPDWATYNGYLVDKCKYANQVADDLLLSFQNLSNFGLAIAGIAYANLFTLVTTTSITGILVGTVAVSASMYATAAAIVLLIIGVGLYGSHVYNYFERISNELTKADLVCALYGATDEASAQTRILEAFDNAVVASLILEDPDGITFSNMFTQLCRYVMPVEYFRPLFDETVYHANLPDADCSACLGVGGPTGLAQSLLHYYELEESSGPRADSVAGVNNDPIIYIIGSPSTQVGISGMSHYNPIGNSGWMRTEYGGTPVLLDVPYTVSVWAKCNTDVASGQQESVIETTNAGSDATSEPHAIQFTYNATAGYNYVTVGMATVGFTHSQPVAVGDWVHLLLYHDAENDRLGLSINNGTPEEVDTAGVYASSTADRQTFVGCGFNGSATVRYLHGNVDEFAIHDRLLTSAERTWIYNSGFGRAFAEYPIS